MLKKVIAKVSAFALALTIVGGGGAIAKDAYKNSTGTSYGITVEAASAPVVVCRRITVYGVLYSGSQIRLVRSGNNYNIFVDGRYIRTAPVGAVRILG